MAAHKLRADNMLRRPVSALDQMVRLNLLDQAHWRVVFKRNRQGNATQGGEYSEAVLQRIDRSISAFLQSSDR
ncbi:MAG: hypothetical protein DSZ33_07030, partial [Gammaproteobacteria bacterium]